MVGPLNAAFQTSFVVGREPELETISRLFEGVRAGDGAVLLISGEAGIGKSRLITEIEQRFQEITSDAALMLQGNCFEGDRDYPAAPLLDMFRRWSAHRPDEYHRLVGGDLAEIFPEVAPPGDESTDQGDSAPDQRRLFRGISDVVVRLASARQLLIVIEDLHWADEITLEILLRLARTASEHGALLVLSYRSDEIDPVLQHTLATLDRERFMTEIPLQPLERSHIDAMLRTIFNQPQPIRADFLDAIQELTDGNPFFIEEVVRALISAGDIFLADGIWSRKEASEIQVPRSVHDAVWRRTQKLSSDARELLALAAVAGRQFSFSVLQQLSGLDEAMLIDQLRELVDNQLIQEQTADQFTFRHALTREAVYTRLLRRERQRLHRMIAEAIERDEAKASEYRMAELAYHFDAAGLWERALPCAAEAGKLALRLFAPRSAAVQFSRALEAAERLGRPPDPDIHRRRGEAWATLGQYEQANQDCELALELVRTTEDRGREWEALIGLGKLWTGLNYDRAGNYFQQAHDLAREMGDDRAEAMSLLQLGNWQANVERVDEANQSLSRALAGFEALNDQRGRAEALDLLGVVADGCGDIALMKAYYARAEELYRELDDRIGVVSTGSNVAIMAGGYSSLETISLRGGVSASEARSVGEQMIALALDLDWRSGEAYVLIMLGAHHLSQGDYADAVRRLHRCIEISGEINHHEWMAAGSFFLGQLYAELFDPGAAFHHLERGNEVARESGSLWMLRMNQGGLACCHIEAGNLDDAATLLGNVDDRAPMHTMGARILWLARARLLLASGAAGAALGIVDRLFASARNFHSEPDIPALARRRAECLIALERYDEAFHALKSAREGAKRYGLRPLLWRVCISQAELLRRTGEASAATAALAEARAVVDELSAGIPDPALRDQFVSGAAALMRESAGSSGALTPREQDVAALIAKGLSNREIADRLFIGERTVETHVGNVLSKLGLTSRVQVAAWMLQSSEKSAMSE